MIQWRGRKDVVIDGWEDDTTKTKTSNRWSKAAVFYLQLVTWVCTRRWSSKSLKRKAIGLTFVYYSATKKGQKKRQSSPLHLNVNLPAERLKSQPWVRPIGTEVGDVRIESRSIGSSVFFRLLKGTTAQDSSLKELQHKVRLLKATTVQGSSLKELQHVSSLKELQHKVRIYRNYSASFVYKGTIAHVSSLNELIHQFHP